MNLPIDNYEDFPVFYRFYKDARIYSVQITLREYSEQINGMIICPGYFYKPTVTGVKGDRIKPNAEKNE